MGSCALCSQLTPLDFTVLSFFARLSRYDDFRVGKKRILVATDLVGRGIDIERINIVVNYDTPDSADSYLHRVGFLLSAFFVP